MDEWISVKDRKPECGTVLATNGRIVITAPASSVRSQTAFTYWMPLPEPPDELTTDPGDHCFCGSYRGCN